MQFNDKGRHPLAPRMSTNSSAGIAALERRLTAVVERMEAEVTEEGMFSAASAQELRELSAEAERVFGGVPEQNLRNQN